MQKPYVGRERGLPVFPAKAKGKKQCLPETAEAAAATASVANALAESATVNVNQLVQTEGEFLTLNGGSADSRA